MLVSRGFTVLKAVINLEKNNFQQLRKSSTQKWRYRCAEPLAPRWQNILATAVQGMVYFWMLWHLVTQPGHIIGEFPYPNPREWTNEELGIPEDDDTSDK